MESNPRAPFVMSTRQPKLKAPNGKHLIVHVVVNLEHWPFDQPTPRTIVVPPHGRSNTPDLPNFCWAEYGVRCGMPRLLKLFSERQIPVTASVNATAIDVYPTVAEEMLRLEWEFIGHGIHQRALHAESDERGAIEQALARLEQFSGRRPRGWMSPGWTETFDTPDLLRAAGVEYVCQWVIDDVPTWLRTSSSPLLALPYGLDLNDSVVFAIEKHSSDEMAQRIRSTIEVFGEEIRETGQVRILTIPLHPHLSGVPHRLHQLRAVIDDLRERDDTVFMNGSAILDWFTSQHSQGNATAQPARSRVSS